MSDSGEDMIIGFAVSLAIIPISVFGGKLVSSLKTKYLNMRGKATVVIPTSAGNAVVPGTKIGSATFINPGPLEGELAGTFSGGRYVIVETTENINLYRAWGGNSKELGMFWATNPPQGSIAAQIDSALLPEWGNTATKWTMIEVPKGTRLYIGEAASQGGIYVGGTPQVIIKEGAKESWKVASGVLK